MGLTLAVLKTVGYIPRERDLLNNCASGFAIRSTVSLINITGRPSGPVDLFVSREFRMLSTSCSFVVIWLSSGTCLFIATGGGSCVSGMSSVDCEVKWSMRIVALSKSSVTTLPSRPSKGGIVSFRDLPIISRSI